MNVHQDRELLIELAEYYRDQLRACEGTIGLLERLDREGRPGVDVRALAMRNVVGQRDAYGDALERTLGVLAELDRDTPG